MAIFKNYVTTGMLAGGNGEPQKAKSYQPSCKLPRSFRIDELP
jgi:hypothetical protein